MTMLERLQKVQEYLNGTESAKFLDYYYAEHYSGYLCIVEDEDVGCLHLVNGKVDNVSVGWPENGEQMIGVGGPKELWDHIGDYYQRSVHTMNVRFANDPRWKQYGPDLLNRQFNGPLNQACRVYSYVREGAELYYDHPKRDADRPLDEVIDYVRGFYINVNGVKIYVETNDGPTDKATIIALHTAGRENRQYHDLMRLFKDKYRIYAPDQPGHGKSMPLPGNVVTDNNEDYVKWIWDITCKLGVKDPIYMGCSMSGGITYYMALEHPDAVRGCICMQGNDNTKIGAANNLIGLLTHPANNVGATQRDFSDSMIGHRTAQSRKDFIQWGVMCEISTLKKGDFMECYNLDISDRVHEIKCPVCIIEGDEDTAYTVEMAKGTMQRLTGCENKRLEVVEGYGHFIAVENPERVAEIVDNFISSFAD